MTVMLPEMLQLEMFRDSSLVKLANPEGKEPKSLWEISITSRFPKPESLSKLVNLLVERLSTLSIDIDEALIPDPTLPPSPFLERLTSRRLFIDQNQAGTRPWSELLERSIMCSWDMFLRYFQEMLPLKFLEGSLISVIEGWEQFEAGPECWNQERLKPETELKAFETSSWSVLLHVDSTNTNSEKTNKNLQNTSIFLASQHQVSTTVTSIFHTRERAKEKQREWDVKKEG